MNRRKFLTGSLVTGAAMVSGARIGRDGLHLLGSAEAATNITPYPVLLITLRGGMDPAMNLVAQPNGSFGSVTIANRMSGTSALKTTASGIRYFTGTVAAAGKAQFEAHLPDVALLRGFHGGSDHGHTVADWFGDYSSSKQVSHKNWGNYVAASHRAAGVFVPKPCVVMYPTRDTPAEPFHDLVAYGDVGPNPAVSAERALSYSGFFDSLSAGTGMPPFARQQASYALARAIDGRAYTAAAQPNMTGKFDTANTSADDAMKAAAAAAASGPAWPPPANVLSGMGVTMADFTKAMTVAVVKNAQAMTFALQALSKGLTHVMNLTLYGYDGSNDGWDSHNANYSQQLSAGSAFWSNLGKLVTLMKATPSPIVAGKSLFETTNIWVQSEMGRTAQADLSVPGNGNTASGTGHWPHGCAVFMGGRFKRGIAIGGMTGNWEAMPINPVTGAAGNTVAKFNNLIATVIKASGADPGGYVDAAPIDALLNMSL